MKKIVFILNSVQQQRCIKRVSQFVKHGFAVEVYGFSRKVGNTTHPDFTINILGSFSNKSNYLYRALYMLRRLSTLLWKYRNQDIIFYFFGLDIMLLSKPFIGNRNYIYEESDLMHTYINNFLIRSILEKIDKKMITSSLHAVFTSEGFYQYHFGTKKINNVTIIPNKLNEKILEYKQIEKTKSRNLRLGFVGAVRYKSLLNFARVIAVNFPSIEFHFWGNIQDLKEDFLLLSHSNSNIKFHGTFINPDDLPNIYSNIDIVVAVYDYTYENVRYAEPNKLYEAIYFNTPIIVSCNTFLSSKVLKYKIGYVVDPFNDESIINMIKSMNTFDLELKEKECKKFEKSKLISVENDFFDIIIKKSL